MALREHVCHRLGCLGVDMEMGPAPGHHYGSVHVERSRRKQDLMEGVLAELQGHQSKAVAKPTGGTTAYGCERWLLSENAMLSVPTSSILEVSVTLVRT